MLVYSSPFYWEGRDGLGWEDRRGERERPFRSELYSTLDNETPKHFTAPRLSAHTRENQEPIKPFPQLWPGLWVWQERENIMGYGAGCWPVLWRMMAMEQSRWLAFFFPHILQVSSALGVGAQSNPCLGQWFLFLVWVRHVWTHLLSFWF